MPSTTSVQGAWSEKSAIRFGTTFLANVLRAAFSFCSGILIARGLGASGYGDLSFLLGSFAAISQLLDSGTSSAFYTFISQRRRSRAFALLYTAWMGFQFAITVLVVGFLLPSSLIVRIWVGHERPVVLLAFASSFLMTQLWGMVNQLGEALRKTVIVQTASVAQAIVHVALIALVIHWGWLTGTVVLWLIVGEYLLLGVILGPKLLRWNLAEASRASEGYKAVLGEFASYCAPLIIYGWVGFLYTFADQWLLQKFGGSEQQGFFSVGQQVANISLIATTSILKVFWKEIAEARDRQDDQRVQYLYASLSRSLYFCAAAISCLLIPYTREILIWTVGTSYERGWVCLAIMFLCPVLQSLGQIQGTFFYAISDTKNYAKIGLLMMGISIPLTYFLLAPRSAVIGGLELGAVGLATKLVILHTVGASLQGFVIARTNGWPYDHRYQVFLLAILFSLAWVCKWISGTMLGLAGFVGGPLQVMLLGSLLYAGLLSTLLYRQPGIAGMTPGLATRLVSGTARWRRPHAREDA